MVSFFFFFCKDVALVIIFPFDVLIFHFLFPGSKCVSHPFPCKEMELLS